jgi:hypothetical protein
MLGWSEYIENAERLASLNASERWTVNGVNALLAGQTVAWAGYGPSWVSAIIFVGTWLGLTFLLAFAAGQAVSRSWSADTYKRKAEAQSREEEEGIRVVCAKMLYDTGLLNPSRAAPS